MTDMTPGPVVEAATPGSGGTGVRESGEGSKTPVPPRIVGFMKHKGFSIIELARRCHSYCGG